MTSVNYTKISKDCPVGRDELLSWINSIVGVGYRKIEDCANGAAFCQVIDALHPDSINLGKVKFDATSETDIINNYKILQEGLFQNHINKNLHISEFLTKKVNASLEMLQWLYQYSHLLLSSINYNPYERRKQLGIKEPKLTRISSSPNPTYQYKPITPNVAKRPQTALKPRTPPTPKLPEISESPSLSQTQKHSLSSSYASTTNSASKSDTERRIRHLEKKVMKLEYELDATIKERDFYWKRLRQIELYCANTETPEAQNILEMLCQTESENGFVTPE